MPTPPLPKNRKVLESLYEQTLEVVRLMRLHHAELKEHLKACSRSPNDRASVTHFDALPQKIGAEVTRLLARATPSVKSVEPYVDPVALKGTANQCESTLKTWLASQEKGRKLAHGLPKPLDALTDHVRAMEAATGPFELLLERIAVELDKPVNVDEPPIPNRPRWDASTGELWLGGKRIARFQLREQPTKPQLILNAFETSNWARRIDNPLWDGDSHTRPDSRELAGALEHMNEQLKEMSLHSQEGGRAISWAQV